MFKIELTRQAAKQLRKLPAKRRNAMVAALRELEPLELKASTLRKLSGHDDMYRMRV